MIVFNGGLTIEQVNKLKNGEYVIYDKIPYKRARAAEENTFDYVPKEMYSMPLHIFRRYIAEDVFSKQYIFLAKYLYTTFEFCNNSQKKNYIMVCDIEEDILNEYIGVGNYIDYRIEFRLPRKFISPDKIKEFLFFEPYDDIQMRQFKDMYEDKYYPPSEEDELARRLIKQKKLEFNGQRNWK